MSGSNGTPAEGQAGAGGSGPETEGGRCGLSCLLTLCSGFPEILEVDGGASPGAKAGDTDLDYEILDRAGERASPQPLQHPLPWAGQERARSGIFREATVSPGAGQRAVAVTSPWMGSGGAT